MRAYTAQDWLVSWVCPLTQTEFWAAPVAAVLRVFDAVVRAELSVYERCAAPGVGAVYRCATCDGRLWDATEVRHERADGGAGVRVACPRCDSDSAPLEALEVPPSTVTHLRVTHALRPLARSLARLRAAHDALCRARDASAHAAARRRTRAAGAPTVVYARRRVTRGQTERNFDVAIGPGSAWELPFRVTGARAPSAADLRQYRQYILDTPALRTALVSLRGKTLGCPCRAGPACHGRVLAALYTQLCT